MNRQISYAKRDFASLRREQFNFIGRYYPEVIKDLSDASIMSVFVDLNAAIADNLHASIDKALHETILDFAQERKSLYYIAKTYGLHLPSKSPSMSVCDFSVVVPVYGDKEDARYLPIIRAGAQVLGGGQVFETTYDIDFSSPVGITGVVDRTKIPNFVGGKIVSYTITKKGLVINGSTKIFSQIYGNSQPPKFTQIVLPDKDVISVDSIITKNGTNYTQNPTYGDFINDDLKWYRVNSLAQPRVFVPDYTQDVDADGLLHGHYLKTNRKFIVENTPNGFTLVRFGSLQDDSRDILDDFIDNDGVIDLLSTLNNDALGMAPRKNTTMYIKYRVGGGSSSNVGQGVLNEMGSFDLKFIGSNLQTQQSVKNSLRVTNIIPAIGGSDQPTMDELRHYIAYNFAAQERAVTLLDYQTLVKTMPSKFGSPSRVGVRQNRGKIEINLITYDNSNKFNNIVSSTITNNVANYLSEYRMINDLVEINAGEVIDLGFEIGVLIDDNGGVEIINNVIKTVADKMNPKDFDMGDSLVVNEIVKAVGAVGGVISFDYIKVFNKVGGLYSTNEVNQAYTNVNTREIDISSDGVVYAEKNQILQLKYPEKDIVIKPRTRSVIRQ